MIRVPLMNAGNQNPIGMIISSMLTEIQFQATNGVGWILADGRNVAGSQYATTTGLTTVPDLRGMVLRGKNNGRADGNQNPDGDSALGAFQSHQFGSHNHGGGSHAHNMTSNGTNGNAGTAAPYSSVAGPSYTNTDDIQASGTIISTEGGNETRMKNVTVNHFIKINP